MANYQAALAPAMAGQVDMVVHGGDLLYRRRVPAGLVEAALEPLARVADLGVPVFLVPGNHEGSQIPRTLLSAHPDLHVFHEAMTVALDVGGVRVAVAGFPFARRAARDFDALVTSTGASGGAGARADVRLLCIHQAVEGAQVGASNYTFRSGRDVVPGQAIPQGFAAVLAGHIHRGQVLRRDLGGSPLACPVIYPGSVERTSFAERREEKGYVTLTVAPRPGEGSRVSQIAFHGLPARPMFLIDIDAQELRPETLVDRLRSELTRLPADAVVRVRLLGAKGGETVRALSAARVRSLAPATMNVTVRHPRETEGRRRI